MLWSRHRRRAIGGAGGAFVVAVALASLGLWAGVASARPPQTFAASCSLGETTATWSGLHVKTIDITWLGSDGQPLRELPAGRVKGGSFVTPTPSGATAAQVTFEAGPGKSGGPVDTENVFCDAGASF